MDGLKSAKGQPSKVKLNSYKFCINKGFRSKSVFRTRYVHENEDLTFKILLLLEFLSFPLAIVPLPIFFNHRSRTILNPELDSGLI